MWLSMFTRVGTTPANSSLTPSLPTLIVTAVSYYLVQSFNIYMVSQLNGRNNESHWVYTKYFNNIFLINNLKLKNIILFFYTIRTQYCCTYKQCVLYYSWGILEAWPGSVLFFCGQRKPECFQLPVDPPFKLSNKELLWSRLRQFLVKCWERSCETSYKL